MRYHNNSNSHHRCALKRLVYWYERVYRHGIPQSEPLDETEKTSQHSKNILDIYSPSRRLRMIKGVNEVMIAEGGACAEVPMGALKYLGI